MAVVAVFLFLLHVDDRESDGGNVAVLDVDARPFEFRPVIHRAVGVAEEIHRGIVGETAVGPARDAVLRGEMVGLAVAPVVDDDMVAIPAVPEDGIFKMAEVVLG